MIESIDISNYESHEHTHVDLHPNVNVFIGQSDHGKSAILRAVHWVRTNRPSGNSFRSSWGGDTVIKLELPDVLISRIKSKKNKYGMQYDGHGKFNDLEFEAMGLGVPAEVVKALNLPDLNVQYQMDPPFLLSSSAGDVAQLLNEVSGLDVISTAQSNIESKVRGIKATVAFEDGQLAAYEDQLAAFAYLDKMEKEVLEIEALDMRCIKLEKDKQRLFVAVVAASDFKARLEQLDYINAAEKELKRITLINESKVELSHKASVIDLILSNIDETENALTKYSTLDETLVLLEKLILYNKQADMLHGSELLIIRNCDLIKDTTRKLEQFKHLEDVELLLTETVSVSERADVLYNKIDELKRLIKRIRLIDQDWHDAQSEVSTGEEWWEDNAPDICPLCDGKGKLK